VAGGRGESGSSESGSSSFGSHGNDAHGAGSRGLRRLLRVRNLEMEQRRIALESALGHLRRLEQVRVAGQQRNLRGRQLIADSVQNGEPTDRQAGLEEMAAAERIRLAVAGRIWNASQEVSRLHQEYLEKRVESRQAETLIQEAASKEAAEAERSAQSRLDDWFRNRLHRLESQSRIRNREAAVRGAGKPIRAHDGEEGGRLDSK